MNKNPTVLVTSGGTKIPIDMVRSITNMSKGNFGSKIAREFVKLHCNLTFLHALGSKQPFLLDFDTKEHSGVEIYLPTFVTFDDYEKHLNNELSKQPDIIVLAAAVSDYTVENYVDGKIRSGDSLIIKLKPLPKLISTVRQKCPKATICGFKLLVNSTREELEKAVTQSMYNNLCDLVVGNDLSDIKKDDHRLIISEWHDTRTTWKDDRTIPTTTTTYTKMNLNGYDSLADVVAKTCLNKHQSKQEKLDEKEKF